MEKWAEIPNYPGYQVSASGGVRSFWSNGGSLINVSRRLSPTITGKGYKRIGLRKNKKPRIYFLHRLILETFNRPPEIGEQCNHLNGDKSDNRLINLEWVSPSENLKHAYKNQLKTNNGDKHSRRKLAEMDVLEIRSSSEKGIDLAAKYNVSASLISTIRKRKCWKHI